MSLGKISLIENSSWTYSFIDKNWDKKQEIFEIINLKEKTDLEQKYFEDFWGAQSPYEDWKKKEEGKLKITDSLLKLNTVKWYVESILLHELSDYDNNEDSMLESEVFVMDRIHNDDTLSAEEKQVIINYHLWFFQNNKLYFENLFKEWWEKYYKDHKNEYDAVIFHYNKICGVVEYLEWMIK